MAHSIDEVFQPPGEAWHRVSPRLMTARRLVLLLLALPLALLGGVAVAAGAARGVLIALFCSGLVALGWAWWLIGRRVRSYGYAERDEDLLVTRGIMFRRLTVVPYGRMQLVEVVSGPIERSFGLTTVRLHTAAPTTDATIPGLLAAESGALRDRLSARGEDRSAGL